MEPSHGWTKFGTGLDQARTRSLTIKGIQITEGFKYFEIRNIDTIIVKLMLLMDIEGVVSN